MHAPSTSSFVVRIFDGRPIDPGRTRECTEDLVVELYVAVTSVTAAEVHPQSATAEVVQVPQVDFRPIGTYDVVDDLDSDLLQ